MPDGAQADLDAELGAGWPRRGRGQPPRLRLTVKVITGDHPAAAVRVRREIGLDVTGMLTGADLARLDDDALPAAIARTTLFAGVTPDDKARVLRAQRHAGTDAAFLCDGVNDAPPCTRPMSLSRWTRPPMLPKTPPTCCFWTRTSGCSPTVSSRDAASSPTPSSTC